MLFAVLRQVSSGCLTLGPRFSCASVGILEQTGLSYCTHEKPVGLNVAANSEGVKQQQTKQLLTTHNCGIMTQLEGAV
jgi:hypothetical protein